jgi:hypothetical protein
MHKLILPLTFATMAAALISVSPALAQNHPNRNPPMGIDCSLPENANNPACLPANGKSNDHRDRDHGHSNDNDNNNSSGSGGNAGSGNSSNDNSHQGDNNNDHHGDNNDHHDNNGGMDHGPQNGSFNWSRHDRDHFHQQFHGFNFGFFGVPNFSIHIGTAVPRSFDLRPVPRSIYRDYPWFRGYLFFVTRGGDIVIVSPRSHRIVGII